MTPIDLIDYTNCKDKISSQQLGHFISQKNEIKSHQKLAAYFIDTVATFAVSVTLSVLFHASFSQLVLTNQLTDIFHHINFANFSLKLMPLLFVSYFFFCFFFNSGQSIGMNFIRTRIEMSAMSFRSSLFWALYSATVVMSGGLMYFLTYNRVENKGWGSFQGHDHLYHSLMQDRDLSPIDLMATIKVEDEYLEAA